jgi:hypothetical protein
VATGEGIFVIFPEKLNPTYKIDISNIGSATIITNGQNVYLSNGLVINGRLAFIGNQPYIPQNSELWLEHINIKNRGNDILVYFDGQRHNGNYISYGSNNLIAQGNNFDLEIEPFNNLVRMYGDSRLTSKPKFAQGDYLYFSIGDQKSKSGFLELTNREDKNLMPLLQTDGYVRMWNDRNDVAISGQKIENKYYWTIPKIREGSVSMELIADGDASKVYNFDENRRIFAIDKESSDRINEWRSYILTEHNVRLRGFFNEYDLVGFSASLNSMKEVLGIDFTKVERSKKQKIEIIESDRKLEPDPHTPASVYMIYQGDVDVWWNADRSKGEPYKISAYSYEEKPGGIFTLTHEVGHVLTTERLINSFKKIGASYDIYFSTDKKTGNSGPFGYAPRAYSETDVYEFIADIFTYTVHYPKWFNEFPTKLTKNPALSSLTPEQLIKAKQAFRDALIRELKEQDVLTETAKNPKKQ